MTNSRLAAFSCRRTFRVPRFAFRILFCLLLACPAFSMAHAEEMSNINSASAAQADFGMNLFRQLATQAENKNVFISPSSIATALRMAMEGAAGSTLGEMQKCLGPASSSEPTRSKEAAPGVTLEIANSIWSNSKVHIRPQYIELIKQKYDALARALAFGTPGATDAINQWVAERTHGKIDKIVGELDAMTALVLVNAIYFKGKWHKAFDKKDTVTAPFHKPGGDIEKPRMSQSGKFDYKRGAGYQAIRLPYGDLPAPARKGVPKNRQLPPQPGPIEAIIILPDAVDGLPALVRDLSGAKWRELVGGFARKQGTIKLPRFKANYDQNLVEPLKRLGMELAFDANQADFSRMIEDQPAFISQVQHKAVVEVNEEGTEAAAATAVVMSLTGMPVATPEPPFEMIVDHPFLFAVRDSRNEEVLFLGAIYDPE